MKNKILSVLIVLSGLFFFKPVSTDIFYNSQLAFLILIGGITAGFLIYEKSRLLGIVLLFSSLSVFKTMIFRQAPFFDVFESAITGASLFVVYYASRHFRLKENYLMLFLIPAFLNVIFVLAQKFDGNAIVFLNVKDTTGFLGGSGVTACYLGLTAPIFLKYFKKGFIFLIAALIITGGITGLTACFVSVLFYLWHKERKLFFPSSILILVIAVLFFILNKDSVLKTMNMRLSMFLGAVDGIKENPVLGWGIGSWKPVMKMMAEKPLVFNNIIFNCKDWVMTHPHNEFLLWCWNSGIVLPVLIFFYIINVFKKFTKDKIIPFSILVGSIVCSLGYFLSPPAWILVMLNLGICENKGDEDGQTKGFKE